jgi:hypothetical protein
MITNALKYEETVIYYGHSIIIASTKIKSYSWMSNLRIYHNWWLLLWDYPQLRRNMLE